jgi:hypothetical protein
VLGSKVPFWQFFHSAKMALLNPCMKFKTLFGQKNSFEALYKQLVPGSAKSKAKRTHEISKILVI